MEGPVDRRETGFELGGGDDRGRQLVSDGLHKYFRVPQGVPPSRPSRIDSKLDAKPGAMLSAEARRDFAVVVPAFNEAPVVADLVAELKATFERFQLCPLKPT